MTTEIEIYRSKQSARHAAKMDYIVLIYHKGSLVDVRRFRRRADYIAFTVRRNVIYDNYQPHEIDATAIITI